MHAVQVNMDTQAGRHTGRQCGCGWRLRIWIARRLVANASRGEIKRRAEREAAAAVAVAAAAECTVFQGQRDHEHRNMQL